MKEILLTEEQARQIAESKEPIELRDAAGTLLVKIDPIDARALADYRRRKLSGVSEPVVPAEHVEAYLQRLQAEWDKSGPFDKKRADEIFDQMYPSEK